jgi:hypothetical protein
MADQLEKDVITIVNFVVANNGKQILTLNDIVKKSKTEIPPHTSHTFDSAGPYLGYIDGKIAFELVFREGSLVVNRGKAFSDGGEILITATLT